MEYAFFDVCGHVPDESNERFVLAGKMHHVHHRVDRIYDLALRAHAPMLGTTCMGLMRENAAISPRACAVANSSDTAFVPMDATAAEIAFALTRHRILFERLGCKTPQENVKRKTFDVFSINPHAETIVRALGDRQWFVFGAGFEHCLQATVIGLRERGYPVTVLTDGCIHGGVSTPVTFADTYEKLRAAGANWAKTNEVFTEEELA